MTIIKPLKNISTIGAKALEKAEKTITQTIPSQSKSELIPKSTSLVMDAKATLAMVKLDYPIDESKYREFEKLVIAEIQLNPKIAKQFSPPDINPINECNINSIKDKLKYFTEEIDPNLKQEVMNCDNPKKLFRILKDKAEGIAVYQNDRKLTELLRNAMKVGITPDIRNGYNDVIVDSLIRYRRMINIFTQKSTDPKVQKIEAEVKALGVNSVNFSNDLEEAKLVKEVIEDLIKKKIPLPHAITVSPIIPTNFGGTTINTNFTLKRDDYICLPFSIETSYKRKIEQNFENIARYTSSFNNADIEFQNRFIDEFNYKTARLKSTKNLKHCIYHEMAHAFQPGTMESRLVQLSDEEMQTAKEISDCAGKKRNGREAMPEMFAMLMDGQTLTAKQMALYIKLGGIVPKT